MRTDMDESMDAKGRFNGIRSVFAISRDFTVLMFALAVVSLGFGLLGPILPTFRDLLGMTTFEISVIYSLFSFAFVFALPPSGLLADRVGRKRMIMSGVLLFGATTYAMVLITEPYQFAILRILEGVGAAMVTPAAFALTLDLVSEDRRGAAMGAEGTAQLIGGLAGPAIGGLVAGEIDFYMPFYFAAALSIVCAFIVWFIREPEAERHTDEKMSLMTMFSAWKQNASEDRALGPLTVRALVMGTVQSFFVLGLLLFWGDVIGMGPSEMGIAMSIGMATMVLGTIPFGIMSDKHGRKPFIVAGGMLMASGLAAMVFASEAWHVYLMVAVSELGAAMSNPSVGAMLGDVMKREARGRVMGAYQTVQGIGNIMGFTVMGVVYEKASPRASVLSAAGALAAATLIIALFVGETHKSKQDLGQHGRTENLEDEPFERR